jgi:undecaprenyl-diphosphatase
MAGEMTVEVRHHAWRRRTIWSLAGFAAAFLVGVGYALALRASGNWTEGLGWERSLLLEFHRPVPRALDHVMLLLPWLGTNLTLMPILIAVAFWLWRRRGRLDLAVQLVVVQVGSLLLNAFLKDLFDRPRPALWPMRGQYQWAAFPSGHAIVGISVMFTVAILLHRERGWRWPFGAATLLLAVNLFSRLYLGVHWPTDVLGGVVIGCVWLLATMHGFRAFPEDRRARGESSVRGSEHLDLSGIVAEASHITGPGIPTQTGEGGAEKGRSPRISRSGPRSASTPTSRDLWERPR